MKYGVRPGTNEDVPFIMRRTLKDMRNCDFTRSVRNDLFYTYEHAAWEWHLTKSLVRVAYPLPQATAAGTRAGNPALIVGYIVCQVTNIGLVIHYINVRRSVDDYGNETETYRRQGIARQLVQSVLDDFNVDPDKLITYTKRTAMFRYEHSFREFVETHEKLDYNPYLFFTLLPEHWETGIKRKPSHKPVPWLTT